ncbi:MAG TPA: FHA domain-containing protein [Steroidobacteraceae bacterium]|nr:FHA domain-containing protein [Steroidobacteraceae bacterium]
MYAIELNDRALALADDGEVLACEPSIVFEGSGAEPAGTPAHAYLKLRPGAVSSTHLCVLLNPGADAVRAASLLASDVSRRLAAHPVPAGAAIWIATSTALPPYALGVLLGAIEALGLRVGGFVDAAVVSAAALGLDRPAIALDLGLHHLAASALECGGEIRLGRTLSSTRGGLLELHQAWLALIATMLVKRTRFDVLHEAVSEQQLFDEIPRLAREAAADGSATALISHEGDRFEVPIARDQFVQAAEPIYRELLRVLHALRPAGAPVTLMLPRAAAELPGLREACGEFEGCEIVTLADGFAAVATSVSELPEPAAPVQLLRRLAAQRCGRCESLAVRELLTRTSHAVREATHVIYAGKAYPLGAQPVLVGRAASDGRAIVLPEGTAGISRRHCSFVREGSETVLVDHSRFGTLVNGERVAERARVRAGDRVRLGEPGLELTLIDMREAASQTHVAPPAD